MIERVFISQGMKRIRLEDYFKKELTRAGFTGMKMHKTPLVTRIVLHVAKPGLAIGKKGKTIRTLTEDLTSKFGIENPQIEIQQIEKPELDAKAMVDKIKMLLSRGYSWRSVAFRSVEDVMNAGAQGVELVFKGKLAGKGGRKRKERIAKGYMKKAGGQSNLVDYAKGDAYPKAGAIGIKLRIIRPGIVFPDKINIREFIAKIKGEDKTEKVEEKTEKPVEEEKPEVVEEKKEVKEKKDDKKGEKGGKEEKESKAEKKEKTEKKSVKKEEKAEKKPAKKEAKKEEKKVSEKKEKKAEAKEGEKEVKEKKPEAKEEKNKEEKVKEEPKKDEKKEEEEK